MQTARDVFAAVRALVDDPEGDYATDETQVPFLQVAVETLESELYDNPNIGKFKYTVVLLNVPQGATSLSDYFASAGALERLDTIISMREKAAGADDSTYTRMDETGELPTLVGNQFNSYFSFPGDDIKLPGASQATDIRIYGTFLQPRITDADSALLPGTMPYFKYKVAALVARAHGSRDLAADYEGQANTALNAILNKLIMEAQLTPTRQIGFGPGSDWDFGGNGIAVVSVGGGSSSSSSASAALVNYVVSGTINGINKIFTITAAPGVATFFLFRNGVLQSSPADFTISGVTITFVNAPGIGDILLAYF